MLGIDMDDDNFDLDIITIINSVILGLSQIGIKPDNSFIVTSTEDEWTDYLDGSTTNLESVKTYMYMKTKLIFDPPSNPSTITAIEKFLSELEWRIMLAIETNNLEV